MSAAMPSDAARPRRNWIAVACLAHALRGCSDPQAGFMQVCHGKRAPLLRIAPGDRVVYYAPTTTLGGGERLQAFVSAGIVLPGVPYAFDMGGGFVPYRRDVAYVPVRHAPIAPLLDALDFVQDRRHWGYPLRLGLLEVGESDLRRIAQALQADLQLLHLS